ncbi:MAG TPA: hypothetical protein ENJ00_08605 [Phycisphaerales bacterium]|nr:hypothetical protein [Phycisphaerales bacterium]
MPKKPRPTLPFPFLGDHPSRCISCGYDLAGVAGKCPECGIRIDGEPGAVYIAGVPKFEDPNPWRRAAFIILAVAATLLSQFFFLIGVLVGFLISLLVLAGVLIAVFAFVVTSRSKKRSIERITFTRAGIGRAAWGREFGDVFIPWRGDEVVEPKSVGTVWQHLTIKTPKVGGLFHSIFECGFRCRREELIWIRHAIQSMAHDEPLPEPPIPTEPNPETTQPGPNTIDT